MGTCRMATPGAGNPFHSWPSVQRELIRIRRLLGSACCFLAHTCQVKRKNDDSGKSNIKPGGSIGTPMDCQPWEFMEKLGNKVGNAHTFEKDPIQRCQRDEDECAGDVLLSILHLHPSIQRGHL